jgi:two-component system chemotaxis response regulator CheY
MSKTAIEARIATLGVLVIDDNAYMRKIVRSLLVNIGVKDVSEAADGIAGIELIRTVSPDIVILDWELPLLNGAEFMRIVRSPDVFPMPDIPVIMLSAHGERWRVLESVKLGVNEFLCKPVSARSLLDRIVSILAKPRPNVRLGNYYGPQPRRLKTASEPELDLLPEGLPSI